MAFISVDIGAGDNGIWSVEAEEETSGSSEFEIQRGV